MGSPLLQIASLLVLFLTEINGCLVIEISKNGYDNPGCMTGSSACLSLHFVLKNLAQTISANNPCVQLDINDNQTLSDPFSITSGTTIQLQGMQNTTISIECINEEVQIVFNGTENISLSNIQFMNCGTINQAAVSIQDSINASITNCVFVNSASVGLRITSLQSHDGSNINYVVSNTSFINNDNSQMSYTDSSFINYNTYSQNVSNNTTLINGGGLSIDLKGIEATSLIRLSNCWFVNNYGWIGGGAYININNFSKHTLLQLFDCKFSGNEAGLLGGGLYIGNTDSELANPEKLNLDIDMNKVIFTDNSAPHAGGIAYQTKSQWSNTTTATVNITNTNFTFNVATLSGAAIGLFKWEAGLGGISITVDFYNCLWTDNSIYRTYTDNATIGGVGVIYSQGIPFSFKGTTIIMNNYGTAILASSVQIYMFDQITISHNSGIRGGAISLVESSRMIIQQGLNITFTSNSADLVGGAVYHIFPVLGVTGQNQYCVFIYYNESITDPSEWEADIWFTNNTALISGQSLYLSSPDSCKQNDRQEIFTENKTFHFIPSGYTNQVTTSPVHVSFESSSINCSNGTNCTAKVMLGEKLNIKLMAFDAFNNPVTSFAAVDVSCVRKDGSIAIKRDCHYELNGTRVVEFNGKKQQMSFHIIGNQSRNYSKKVILTWQLIEVPSVETYLNVEIVPCYFGYVYNKDSQVCECYKKEEVACMEADYSACVQFGYWFGSFHVNGEEIFTSADCSFGSCDYTVNGQCPKGLQQCGPDGSEYQFFCKLPRDNPDSLCLYNKGGVMCSNCQDKYLPTLSNLKCISDDKCHKGYVVIQIILYITYLSVAVFLILLVAKFDLRIGSGQIYCLVFYFSVFKYFVGGVYPSEFLYVVEVLFTGIVQFNPIVFGMIPLCTGIKKFGKFSELLIQLVVNPTALVLTIFVIVYVSWKWPRYAILQNTRLGINAVCIMLYLCFISITQITLTMLTPTKFANVPGVYTSLEPTMMYFHSWHIVYGIIAILLQLVLVFPFLCLLLFSPFLIRFRRLNLTRIKPILDEFQACYKTEYRYFAGYYLACRQLIFLMSFINLGAFAYIYILQILSILILVFHLMVQPYKRKVLNILDGLLILDLVLLSLLHGNTAAIVFDDVIQLKIAFIYILVLLPVAYFVILCVSFLFNYQKLANIIKRCFLMKLEEIPDDSNHHHVRSVAASVGTTVIGLEDSTTEPAIRNRSLEVNEREPLLFSK